MDINELKALKKQLKLTTNDIAYMAELPYSTVSKIFTGETQNPQYLTLEKINAVLQKEAQKARIAAYIGYMKKFFEDHPEAEYDTREYHKYLRQKYGVSPSSDSSDAPSTEGSLAKQVPLALSVSEYFSLETDRTVELIDGQLIYNDLPTMAHQKVVEGLGFAIKSFIKDNNGKCASYSCGINLQLDEEDNSILAPDIVVVCDQSKETDFGILGAPDWIIEVTSPSTRKKDYRQKLSKYMEHGVREYWVIDMQKEIVATYINEMPVVTGIYKFSDAIPVFIYDGKLTICIDDIK